MKSHNGLGLIVIAVIALLSFTMFLSTAAPVASSPSLGCGNGEVIEIHPGSGSDVADFFEVATTGDLGPIKKVQWAGASHTFPTPVIINGNHIPFGDGMDSFGGIDVPGMDLPFSGPARRIWLFCEDNTVVIDFPYGSGSGIVYASQKSGYKRSSGWELTPEVTGNSYGVSDWATPGKATIESPTVIELVDLTASSFIPISESQNRLVLLLVCIILILLGFTIVTNRERDTLIKE